MCISAGPGNHNDSLELQMHNTLADAYSQIDYQTVLTYDADQNEGVKMVQGTLAPGETYSLDIDFALPDNVTDSSRIHVIGILLDDTTGYILNAMSTVPSQASRLDEIIAQHGPDVQIYDLQGHRLNVAQQGARQQQKALRIVKDAQGQCRKVLF